MAITPAQIADAVLTEIPDFFNDSIDQFRDGEGAYIRDGMPKSVVSQVGQAVARSACRQYAAQGPDAVGSKGERFERACRPYLDTLSPGDGIGFETPFIGGQCSEQHYVGTFVYETGTEAAPQTNTAYFSFRGPIIGASDSGGPSSQKGTGITARTGGYRTGTPFGCGGIPPSTGGVISYKPFVNEGRNGRITSISPCGLDNCGNPPPIVVPPTKRPDPTPPPFRFNPLPGIDIPINVELNPDGTISIDLGDGERTVDPFPTTDPGGGGGGGDPGDPTDPGIPGDTGNTGSGGGTDGAAGAGEELVGVLVTVIESPFGANTFDNNTAQVFRGIGYVRMGFVNRLGTDISGGTFISPQFFHAQQRGLTNWSVRANIGFNLSVTPYYRSISS